MNSDEKLFEYAVLAAERLSASQERKLEILKRLSTISDELHLTGEAILSQATLLTIRTMK